jgi:tetratricopeptide (TPR) repeat protein
VFGLGVKYRRYGLDIAMEQGELEATQQVALHVAWGEPVSEYEARRRAEFSKAAEESVMARRAALLAEDRTRAEAAEAGGDWETALLHWEFLHRERPTDKTYSDRAERARAAIREEAKAEVDRESAVRLDQTLAAMIRDALARGDVEEALGLWRGFSQRTGPPPEGYAALEADVRSAADREFVSAVARGDSLRNADRVLAAADAAALALRLRPEDTRALELWAALEAGVGKSAASAASLSRKLEALTAVQAASQAFNEGRYTDAQKSVKKALALDPGSAEAKAWNGRVQRRLSTPRPELDARIKALYVEGMEAFTAGDYRKALKSWEQILVIDPLNENARRNVLEARDRLKAEARR